MVVRDSLYIALIKLWLANDVKVDIKTYFRSETKYVIVLSKALVTLAPEMHFYTHAVKNKTRKRLNRTNFYLLQNK